MPSIAARGICCVSSELGVALSGGGSRGLAQLGVLKVLDREGIPVSSVAGTSAGAIVGSLYVTSRDAVEAEARLLAHLADRSTLVNSPLLAFFGPGAPARTAGVIELVRNVWNAVRPGGSIVGGEALRESLQALLGDATFANARLPFATTALDLVSGRRMIFAAGGLVDAVYASSAIPGLFEPLALEEHRLVDGGWAEPVPVGTCHHLGAIHVIAVEVPNASVYRQEAHAVSTALCADALARNLLEEEQLRKADFVIRVDAPARAFSDFEDIQPLISAGEAAAERVLDDIKAVLTHHRSLFVRSPAPSSGSGTLAIPDGVP
ncbi:MAG TPA: patatin-like phospholipase family protein [Gemmatimonadales bacterium]|nr:patatin-like phospholipase family protein [Gemmatimonadales bacterium]